MQRRLFHPILIGAIIGAALFTPALIWLAIRDGRPPTIPGPELSVNPDAHADGEAIADQSVSDPPPEKPTEFDSVAEAASVLLGEITYSDYPSVISRAYLQCLTDGHLVVFVRQRGGLSDFRDLTIKLAGMLTDEARERWLKEAYLNSREGHAFRYDVTGSRPNYHVVADCNGRAAPSDVLDVCEAVYNFSADRDLRDRALSVWEVAENRLWQSQESERQRWAREAMHNPLMSRPGRAAWHKQMPRWDLTGTRIGERLGRD